MGKKTGLVYVQIGFADGYKKTAETVLNAVLRIYPHLVVRESERKDGQTYNTFTIRIT